MPDGAAPPRLVDMKTHAWSLRSGPYAGVLGWPSQCGQGDERCWPDADKANMEEIMKGQKEGQKEGRGFTSDLAAALRRVPAH